MSKGFQELLRIMVEMDASDLYLKVDQVPYVRVYGAVQPLEHRVLTAEHLAQVLALVLTEPQREGFAQRPDLDVAYRSADGERFRVNCFRQRGHIGMAIRWVRAGDLSLEALHLPPVLGEWAEYRRGLVIVAGATGSGKSTTLSAMVELMNAGRARHIVTIEDPIEYLYADRQCLIEQREVGYDTNSFSDALRHVVRQSPDVIVIGEMRDLDTMRVALGAAMTGHLVLTTLHTTDAMSTVERLLNYFPPDQQQFVRVELAQSLVGILCMRLIETADGTARIPATELLTATALVQKYLQAGDTSGLAELLHSGRTPEVESFQRSLTRLVQAGAISREAALAHAPNADQLELHLSGMYSGGEAMRQQAASAAAAAESPEAVSDPPDSPEPPAEPESRYDLL